jgi:hypothetical protein
VPHERFLENIPMTNGPPTMKEKKKKNLNFKK